MTAATKLLPSEETAALASLVQPFTQMGEGRALKLLAGDQPSVPQAGGVTQELLSASANTPSPSASDMLARPA